MKRDAPRYKAQMWHETPDGKVVKGVDLRSNTGIVTESYDTLRQRAEQVEAVFLRRGHALPSNSGLGTVLQAAKSLSANYARGEKSDRFTLERAAYSDVAAIAVLGLDAEPNAKHHFQRLRSGAVDHLDRHQSDAKDAMWEAEVLRILRAAGAAARLDEMPDVVFEMEGETIGVACKVLYKAKSMGKAVSDAVKQIERCGHHGIVAINISELAWPGFVLVVDTEQQLRDELSALTRHFLNSHLVRLANYFTKERILGVLIGLQTPANASRRLTMASHYYFHVVTGAGEARKRAGRALQVAVAGIPAGDPI